MVSEKGHATLFSVFVAPAQWENMGSGQGKATVPETMLKNFRKGFSRDYRVKLNPGKLQIFCEVEWPSL